MNLEFRQVWVVQRWIGTVAGRVDRPKFLLSKVIVTVKKTKGFTITVVDLYIDLRVTFYVMRFVYDVDVQ